VAIPMSKLVKTPMANIDEEPTARVQSAEEDILMKFSKLTGKRVAGILKLFYTRVLFFFDALACWLNSRASPTQYSRSSIFSNPSGLINIHPFICYYLFFRGQMEYARLIIISS
jgi:hypothetical protein